MTLRAFIADDEAPARARLRRLLADRDFEVVGEAADGPEAVAGINAASPDLVFLDIRMPGATGLEVAAQLQSPRPRIVFCTAFDSCAVDAFALRADDYLLKPINTDRLAATLARLEREIGEARRQAREEADAVRTQQRMLPASAVEIPSFDCFGVSLPAHGVGGDFYDALPIDDERLAVVLGDVSGKGTYAGLLAAALQARVQTLVASGMTRPSAVLSALNRLTVGTMEEHRFATVFVAVFSRRDQAVTYASAGHTPGLLIDQSGVVHELPSTGPAIGWSTSGCFDETSHRFRPGDRLVISSDGVTDTAGPDGEPLGTPGLARLMSTAVVSAHDAVTETLAAVDRLVGGAPAADDRTLLVVRALGSPKRCSAKAVQ
jgi:serine phosphatase RsbU (regulator of sigma subunit)